MPSARRVSWAKFRVTTVSFAAIAILFVLIYLLTGGTLLQPKVSLYLYIPDATGLSVDSPVRVNGIGAGLVKKIELTGSNDPSRIVRVTMTMERNKLDAISTDSQAQISTDTLVGDKYVDVTSGKESGHIAPGGTMNFRDKPDLMRTIDLTDFENQLRIVDATLTDIEQGRNQLGQFVLTDTVYVSLRKKFIELQGAIVKAKRATSMAGGLIYTDVLYRKLSDPFVQLDQKLALLQSGQGGFGKFLHDPAQYEQTRTSVQSLRKAIAGFQSADFIATDTMYFGWNQTVAQLSRKVDEVNAMPMFSSSEMYDNLSGAAGEMRKTIKDFRENPRRYLRLKIF
jgi:phospholipid/cholesterol/gamma-HCH transport system substrate-binding protein